MAISDKAKTAREKAYLKIRKAIFRGKFPPGSHLKEEEIAEYCDVSRTPARQALRMLASEGLVSFGPNKRCYVSDVTETHAEEIFDLLSMLEGYSARLAAKNISREQLAELKQLQAKMSEIATRDSSGDFEFLDLNSRFHRTIHAASGNKTLFDMINRIVDFPQNVYLKFGRSTEHESSVGQHAEIINALERGDLDYAELQMKRHVEHIRREFRHIWTNG